MLTTQSAYKTVNVENRFLDLYASRPIVSVVADTSSLDDTFNTTLCLKNDIPLAWYNFDGHEMFWSGKGGAEA